MTYYQDEKPVFDFTSIDSDSVAIIKWYNVEGNIFVPDHLANGLKISVIKKDAFLLADTTLSVSFVSDLSIEEGAFDTQDISKGFSPIIKINKKIGNSFFGNASDNNPKRSVECLANDGWEVIASYWGNYELIMLQNLITYESADSTVKFTYRKTSESEVEIIKWSKPTSQIVIPSHLNDNLSVVSLGSHSFKDMLDAKKIIVPPTVNKVDRYAFYSVNEAQRSYYGACYLLSNGEDHEKFCEIYLPAHICIESMDAFLRGTDLHNKFGSYERYINDSLVITLINSPTYNFFISNGWRVACEKKNLAVLVDKSFGTPFVSFDFENFVIDYPESWK